MHRKTVATLLVLLTLSPFTAPFATCDLPTLLNRSTTQKTPGSHPFSVTNDATVMPAQSVVARTARVKLIVTNVQHSSSVGFLADQAFARHGEMTTAVVSRSQLNTILRL